MLSKRMYDILQFQDENLMVAIPDILKSWMIIRRKAGVFGKNIFISFVKCTRKIVIPIRYIIMRLLPGVIICFRIKNVREDGFRNGSSCGKGRTS